MTVRHPITFLWATPRSTSTAFEWMMRMRGDMACFHEPFGQAWYYGPEALAPNRPETPPKPDLTYASVEATLMDAAAERPVFIKDFPQYAEHLFTPDWLGQFRHTFLIRDPAKVLSSLQRSYEKSEATDGFSEKEIGFFELQALFDQVWEMTGTTPFVMDSDDLLEQPEAMVAAYCAAIDRPFIKEALSWEPGKRDDVIWYDGDDSVWHQSLKDSDGLKPQPRKAIDVANLSAEMQDMYERFMEPYEAMKASAAEV